METSGFKLKESLLHDEQDHGYERFNADGGTKASMTEAFRGMSKLNGTEAEWNCAVLMLNDALKNEVRTPTQRPHLAVLAVPLHSTNHIEAVVSAFLMVLLNRSPRQNASETRTQDKARTVEGDTCIHSHSHT